MLFCYVSASLAKGPSNKVGGKKQGATQRDEHPFLFAFCRWRSASGRFGAKVASSCMMTTRLGASWGRVEKKPKNLIETPSSFSSPSPPRPSQGELGRKFILPKL